MTTHKSNRRDAVQHTPGPWTFTPGPDEVQTSDTSICRVCGDAGDDQEVAANARLIAAAPELLAALNECLAWFDLDQHRNRPVLAKDTEIGLRMIKSAREAHDKATGNPRS